MAEFVTILLFQGLLALSYLGVRRTVLSQSENMVLYALFSLVAVASAGTVLVAILYGEANVLQALIALLLMQGAWMGLRIFSHYSHGRYAYRQQPHVPFSGAYAQVFASA